MASQFPATAIDSYTPATSSDTLASMMGATHHDIHNATWDAIIALQTKVGINGSADINSIDKKMTLKQAVIGQGTFVGVAATNSPTNAPTNYGAIAAILGADINATNGKQNTTAANVNDLATRFNALVSWLVAQGLMASS